MQVEMSPELIQRITEEVKKVIAQQETVPASPLPDKRILAIFDAAPVDLPPIVQQLDRCIERGYVITAILSDLAARLLDNGLIQSKCGNERVFVSSEITNLQPFTENFSRIVIPILSFPLAAKLSLGLVDTPCAYLIFQAMLCNKRIIANANPLEISNESGTPSDISKLGQNYIKTLSNFGVQFVSLDQLAESLLNNSTLNSSVAHSKGGKQVITASVIANLAPGTREFVYSNPAIITPLARDLAAQKGLRLVAKDRNNQT